MCLGFCFLAGTKLQSFQSLYFRFCFFFFWLRFLSHSAFTSRKHFDVKHTICFMAPQMWSFAILAQHDDDKPIAPFLNSTPLPDPSPNSYCVELSLATFPREKAPVNSHFTSEKSSLLQNLHHLVVLPHNTVRSFQMQFDYILSLVLKIIHGRNVIFCKLPIPSQGKVFQWLTHFFFLYFCSG